MPYTLEVHPRYSSWNSYKPGFHTLPDEKVTPAFLQAVQNTEGLSIIKIEETAEQVNEFYPAPSDPTGQLTLEQLKGTAPEEKWPCKMPECKMPPFTSEHGLKVHHARAHNNTPPFAEVYAPEDEPDEVEPSDFDDQHSSTVEQIDLNIDESELTEGA
jgi:hypothetical protein